MKQTIRVAFRIGRSDNPDSLVAWLPDVPANRYCMVYYVRVGQHGEGGYSTYQDRAAKPSEYRSLLAELTRIYAPEYKLRIVKRISPTYMDHGTNQHPDVKVSRP